MILNNLDLEKIVIGLINGRGLILPPCKNITEQNDLINQVETYIENLDFNKKQS
jgi:hypothetical protein